MLDLTFRIALMVTLIVAAGAVNYHYINDLEKRNTEAALKQMSGGPPPNAKDVEVLGVWMPIDTLIIVEAVGLSLLAVGLFNQDLRRFARKSKPTKEC